MERQNVGRANLSIITLVVSLFSLSLHYYIITSGKSDDDSIFFLIFSHRYNFDERHVIRNTWMKEVANRSDVKVTFVVGDRDCQVESSDSLDPYGCDAIPVNATDIASNSLYRASNSVPTNGSHTTNHGFSFKVTSTSVLIKSFSCIIINDTPCDSIKISHVISGKIFLDIQMSSSTSICESSENQCLSASKTLDESLMLPQRFVGLVTAHYPDDSSISGSFHYTFNETNGLIVPLRTYPADDGFSSTYDNHRDGYTVTFSYELADRVSYFEQVSTKEHRKQQSLEQQMIRASRLKIESETHNDILFVDVIDVYRNLPVKLLQALKWLTTKRKIKYIIKSDDDCLLDAKNIISMLDEYDHRQPLWIGNFRKLWQVDLYGKWAEGDYISATYPPFACGSGYVLTLSLASWISDNSQHLKAYQGEDVSLGIWLAPLGPSVRRQENLFKCDKNELEDKGERFYSMPDLSLNKMKKLYERFIL